tara:strand:+ start:9619 stop:10173 length:555 start_codon:yes stop_codon:yes gene_type:complete
MSRIGNQQIEFKDDVQVSIVNNIIKVTGPKGELQKSIPPQIKVDISNNIITVKRDSEDKETKAFHGLTRALINNMVHGVKEGYAKTLNIIGTGYKCEIKSKTELILNLGYSNPVKFNLPESITAEVEDKGTKLKISGADKELVGEISAQIRKLRKPERYKGKGIRYADEIIKLKAGKAAGKGAE